MDEYLISKNISTGVLVAYIRSWWKPWWEEIWANAHEMRESL